MYRSLAPDGARGAHAMPRAEGFVIHQEDCAFEGSKEITSGSVRWRTLISGDRTPTESLTIGVAELGPGRSKDFRPHTHAQAEAYYILSGEGTVFVSGTEHPVRPGSAVFIPGGAEHGAINTGAQLLRLLYVFPSDSFADIQYEFPAP
jgi:quercetin dioxygenase-like cupin family protein